MQLNDDSLEKDNNEFSLDDDSGAISWQDLLSEDDTKLSEIIEQKTQEPETSGEKVFDLNMLADDSILDEIKTSQDEEPVLPADNNENAPLEDEHKEEVENSEPVKEDEPIKDEVYQNQGSYEYDGLLNFDDTPVVSGDTDLSGIVDDELLSLLDENHTSQTSLDTDNLQNAPLAEDTVQGDLLSDSASSNVLDNYWTNSSETSDTTEDNVAIDNEENNNEPDVEIAEPEDTTPKSKPKNTKTLIVLFVFIIFIGIMFGVMQYFGNQGGVSEQSAENIGVESLDEFGNLKGQVPDVAQNNDLIPKKVKENIEDKLPEAEKEKKIIVNVQSSGRSNPFVPSSLFNSKGYASYGADLPMPPDGVIDSPEAALARKLMSISVSGIMFDSVKPSAILKFDGKDYFVQKGDRIDTYTVKQITRDFVEIRNAANSYRAYVGETFKVPDEYIEPANMMKYSGGTRQYVSASEIEINTVNDN